MDHIRWIYVNNKNTTFNIINCKLISFNMFPEPLGADIGLGPVGKGRDVTFELTTEIGAQPGDVYFLKVQTEEDGKEHDPTHITFAPHVDRQAKYTIGGTAIKPTITFDGFADQ